MSDYKWNADAFDAIRIVAANGEFEIVGGDTNEILLEGEEHSHRFSSEPTIAGRWLEIHPFGGGSEWELVLPKSKAWVIELSCASGEVELHNLHARVNLQLGHGDVNIEDCRGVFNVRSGSGDVKFENCVQADAPQAPERVAQEPRAEKGNIPPTPPVPPAPGAPPFPPIPPMPPKGPKIRLGKHITIENDQDWDEYGQQWDEWGERFGEQVSQWAENFSRNFNFGFDFGADDEEKADGVHVRLGHGDAQLELVDALLVTTRVANGDVQIEQGRIAELDVESSRGDVQIESVLPTAAWELVTRHGDIQLVLPGDAYARLDAATRHGDIECDAPLVRVGRPGPGARHGGRMVGTIGEGTGEPVDIHLESQHGDIGIDVERRPSRFAGQPAPQSKAQERSTETRERTASAAASNTVVPVTVTDLDEPENEANLPQAKRTQGYDSQFAILQALQAGEITVAEAEMLLRSLKS